jgi:hypothetical protein
MRLPAMSLSAHATEAEDPAAQAGTPRYAALYPPPVVATRRRKPRLRIVLGFLGFLVGGAIAGYAVGRFGARAFGPSTSGVPAINGLWLLAGMVLSFWPVVVIHEAGHALCGIARGMRAVAIGIGPLRAERGLDGWRFRRAHGIRGIGGFAALVPQATRGQSRLDQAIFLAGGPLANLLTAALAFALVAWLGPGLPSPVSALVLGFVLSSALLGGVNLVPFMAGGLRTDGRVLLDLARQSPDALLQLRLQQVLALAIAGQRPRDWPVSLLGVADDDAANALLSVSADSLRLAHLLDRNDLAGAADAAQRVQARYADVTEAFRPHLAIDLAGYAAQALRDPALVAAWRPLCEGGVTDLSPFRHWLDAEQALLAGDHTGARTASQAARPLVARTPYPYNAVLLTEALDRIDAALPA